MSTIMEDEPKLPAASVPPIPMTAGATGAPFSTDRRALLAAIPAGAVAASIPAMAAAVGTPPSSGWEAAKAAYRSAAAVADGLSAQHSAAEKVASEFFGPGPTREIRYTSPGFTHGPITMAAHERTETVTLHHLEHPLEGLKNHPDFLAYRQEAQAWIEQRNEARRRSGIEEHDAEYQAAIRRQGDAWRAMISYPVATLPELIEKTETALPFADFDEERANLLEHVTADLRRLAGQTAR